MISKKLSAVLSPNGRFVLKKLNLVSKHFLSTNSRIHLSHPKEIRCLCIDKFRINNVFLRESHLKAAIEEPLSENTYAHRFMESSEAYSNTLASPLSFDQDLQTKDIESILQNQWIHLSIPEILQNFERLSIYAAKNGESINDPKYHGILEVLKLKLPNFSDQEIHHLFRCLELWRIEKNEVTYKSLLTALDNECLKRMPNWSLEEILLTNDQFFKLRIARFVEFTWHSLKKVGMKTRKFTPTNLVQYTFFMKVNRRLPVRPYEIEYRVEKHFDKFTIEELAIIAMAFNKYEATLKSEPLIVKVLEKLISEIDNVNDFVLKAILDILRNGAEPEITNQLKILLSRLENHISRFNLKTLTNIMMLQRRVLIHNEQLTSKILERCEKEIKDITLKNLERILLGLHIFNYDPKTTPFYSMAYNELLDTSKATEKERYPSLLVPITMYMLKQQFYPEEILKHILDPDFINKISDSNLYKLDRSYLHIDFCIELEHSEYNGPRVKKDIVNFLMKHHGSLRNGAIKKSLKISQASKTMTELIHIIKKITKSETTAYTDAVLPHVAKTYIILCFDPETKTFLSPSDKLADIPTGTIKYAPDDGKMWYVLLIGSRNLITRDESHKITGILGNEIRQLNRIGYTPIVIPQYKWQSMLKEDEKLKYLQNLLFK